MAVMKAIKMHIDEDVCDAAEIADFVRIDNRIRCLNCGVVV